MNAEPVDWEKITPEHLMPAVKHIRTSFETEHWKYSQVTRELCYAALHPHVSQLPSLAPYKVAFEVYRQIIGRTAGHEFDDLLNTRTPPSVFKAYFDAYYAGLEVNVRVQFEPMLQIGVANPEDLKILPVDWAKSQLELLINACASSIKRWVKEVCDTQDPANPDMTTEDFEERVFWTKWRAPRLIHMQPVGNTPYDHTSVWTREDEARTQQLLAAHSNQFIQYLEIALDKIAGEAHVRVAQSRKHIQVLQKRETGESAHNTKSSPDPQQTENTKQGQGTKSGALMSEYRSELKRGILMQLIRRPDATDLEICRGLDGDGAVELPSSWRVRPGNRLFAEAYLSAKTRHKVEIAISKVRADLRKHGFMDRR
jgi:hypothetical protein